MKRAPKVLAIALAVGVAALPLLAGADGERVVFRNPIAANDIPQLLTMLLRFFVRVATVVCVIFIIWSGFLFVKAQGNPEKITEAKHAFFYALIGTVLMLGAEVVAEAIRRTVESVS